MSDKMSRGSRESSFKSAISSTTSASEGRADGKNNNKFRTPASSFDRTNSIGMASSPSSQKSRTLKPPSLKKLTTPNNNNDDDDDDGNSSASNRLTDLDLLDNPKTNATLKSSVSALSLTSKDLRKRVFRRPYAKVNELGWRQSHIVRKWAIILSDSMAWEIGVLILIVMNCVTLSMASPLDSPDSTKARVLSIIELFFSLAFTVELLTKIVAMGYYTDPTAYMRDPWNILDFVIVTFGWLSEIVGGGGGLTSFRAMRVLRPLRTIKGVPELKRIIESMIAAIPQLGTVFGLCAVCYMLFGILGMQLFAGKMSQRCRDDATGDWDFESGRFCSMNSGNGRQCDEGFTCGNSGSSLNDDISNFDDVFRAFLAVFQSCTLEGWVDMMYALMDTMPAWVPGIYFIILIWIGSLFLLNLVTVVVYIAYSQSSEELAELAEGPSGKDKLDKEIETATMEGLLAVQQNVKIMALQAVDDLNKAILAEDTITSFNDDGGGDGRRRRKDGACGDDGLPSPDGAAAAVTEEMFSRKKHTQAVEMSKIASLLQSAAAQLRLIPNVHVHVHGSDPDHHNHNPNHHNHKEKFEPPKHDESPVSFVCYTIIENSAFKLFMNFLIIFNTVCLAIDHYDMDAALIAFLSLSNLWFTVIFTFEVYAKLKGLGAAKFGEDGFNVFDAVIVFVSLIEILVTPDRGGGISALRSFRIMRLFKLLRSWATLRRILKNMAMTLNSSASFVGLLCLIIFVFSLVGMTMYGGTLPSECMENLVVGNGTICYPPRANYDSLFTSAVVSFQIMTMENWNEVLYLLINANGYWSSAFIILNLLIGGFLMMNIFLAILIDNYTMAVQMELDAARKKQEKEEEKARVRGILENAQGSSLYETGPATGGKDDGSSFYSCSGDESSNFMDGDDSSSDGDGEVKEVVDVDADPDRVFLDPSLHPAYEYNSLCILQSRGNFRHLLFKLVLWPRFDQLILTLICLNCVTLAINEPGADGNGPTGTLGEIIAVFDSIFTYSFILEMVLKLLAFGLLLHPGSYMRNNWNLLDGFIVFTSIIELASEGSGGGNISSLRALRALRALRPLRLVSRFEGLQIVINTMMRAFVPCSSVAAVALVFYTVFSIVGMNLFGGRFYSCSDGSRTCYSAAPGMNSELCPANLDCTGDWLNPESGNTEARLWANPTYESSGTEFSFDDFGSAMTVLFEVASLEMWPSVMYAANDVTSIGVAPERNASEGNSMFFVLFISVMTMFIMELFVTVIIDNFNEIKSERDGSAYMTDTQIAWVNTQKQLAVKKPKEFLAPPPENQPLKRHLFNLVVSPKFEMAIMGFIVANVFFMMTEFQGQPDEWTLTLEILNYIFAFVFALEMVLKWYALSTSAYFKNGWNKFDFTIVVLTVISLILGWANVSLPFDPTLLRVGRIARVFRLVKSNRSLQAITQTIFMSLPSLANVGMVLALIFFIFAVAGMGMFGGIPKGDFINDWCNFDTFVISIVTLFRCATGESWNGLMHDAMDHSSLAVGFFVGFQMVASYVLLNLFIAIILDQMSDQMDAMKEQATQLKQFSAVWKEVKLASVGGDVVSLAVNSSAVTARGAQGRGSKSFDSPPSSNSSPSGEKSKEGRRGSMFTPPLSPFGAAAAEEKKKRWAVKERNVHFIPAFYLMKLVRKLPKPLGLAERLGADAADDNESPPARGKSRARVKARSESNVMDGVVVSEVKDSTVLRFIRELDVPIIDGAWVKYKDVMHCMFFRAARMQLEDDGGTEMDDTDVQWFHLKQFQRKDDLEHDGKMYMSDMVDDGGTGVTSSEVDDTDDIVGRRVQLHKNPPTNFTADEWFAAVIFQAWFRGSRTRMRAQAKKELTEAKEKRRSKRGSRSGIGGGLEGGHGGGGGGGGREGGRGRESRGGDNSEGRQDRSAQKQQPNEARNKDKRN